MKELALIVGFYIVTGLLACLFLSFRKSKNPDAIKAIQLFGLDYNPIIGIVFMLLWPLWIFMQIVEQDTFQPKKEKTKEVKKEDLNQLIGRIGRTVTPMSPSGRINLGEKDYEAISDDGQIDRNEEVEVFAFTMRTLKVRKFQPDVSGNCGQRTPSFTTTP